MKCQNLVMYFPLFYLYFFSERGSREKRKGGTRENEGRQSTQKSRTKSKSVRRGRTEKNLGKLMLW